MCRVRFGLTGIYFDTLEPSRPREEFFQPLIVAIPPVAQNRQEQRIVGLEGIDGEEIKGKTVNATGNSINDDDDTVKTPIHLSLLLSRNKECCHFVESAQTNQQSAGSEVVRDFSPSSSSPSSSPQSSDEDYVHKPANKKVGVQASKLPKTVYSRTTQTCKDRAPTKHIYTTYRKPIKPPAKRVRFAMDVQKRTIPSDDARDTSSSNSSDDSYTDPPSPTEPYDAFAGYYRAPAASRFRHENGQIGGPRMRFPEKGGGDADGADGFLDSEDGSEIDVQDLSVKGSPPRTVPAVARSRESNRVRDQSQLAAGELKSNIEDGLHLEQSQVNQNRLVLPLPSGGHLRYPKLRSGKTLPEPIFVVRSRFHSDAKEKGGPAGILGGGDHGRGILKNQDKDMKASPPHITGLKAPRKKKTPKRRPLSLSDELNGGVRFDEDVGLLIRDV